MAEGPDWHTSTTLLRRLRLCPTDQTAWRLFVDRYGPLVYHWCRHWGLQQADAEDVTQSVLLELARQMRSFQYDPKGSFRAWLKTIAYRTWTRFLESRQRDSQAKTAVHDRLLSTAAGADFAEHLEKESDRELMELAMNFVRLRVQPHTWEAFRLLALEQQSGADVAKQLAMNVGAVFVARSKVQKMLREEIQRLAHADGEEAG